MYFIAFVLVLLYCPIVIAAETPLSKNSEGSLAIVEALIRISLRPSAPPSADVPPTAVKVSHAYTLFSYTSLYVNGVPTEEFLAALSDEHSELQQLSRAMRQKAVEQSSNADTKNE